MKTWKKVNKCSAHIELSQVLITSEYLALRDVISRGHAGSCSLNEEGDHVEKYKEEAESPCFDAHDHGAGGEVVDHSAQDHVNICIDPERCQLCTNQHSIFKMTFQRAKMVLPASERTR